MGEKVSEALLQLKKAMMEEQADPRQGLPEDLFVFSTSIVPCVNIDLFVTHENKLLLTWRNDLHYGKGWHIQGVCVRLQETLDLRIHKTALKELGADVKYSIVPLVVREGMVLDKRPQLGNQLEQSHNISFLYHCSLPENYVVPAIQNGSALKWFESMPTELLKAHRELYGDILEKFFKGELFNE